MHALRLCLDKQELNKNSTRTTPLWKETSWKPSMRETTPDSLFSPLWECLLPLGAIRLSWSTSCRLRMSCRGKSLQGIGCKDGVNFTIREYRQMKTSPILHGNLLNLLELMEIYQITSTVAKTFSILLKHLEAFLASNIRSHRFRLSCQLIGKTHRMMNLLIR